MTCKQCGRRAQLPLCPTCVGQLEGMLADLCWLLVELSTTVARQDRLTVGMARLVEHPSPANMGALELYRDVGAQLWRLAEDVVPAPWLAPGQPRMTAWWLRAHLDAIVRCERADAHYRTIARLVGFSAPGPIHDVINRPDRRFAGECPDCGALCYARHEDVYAVCDECGLPIDVERNRTQTIIAHDLMPERLLLVTLDNLDEHVSRVRFYGWVTAGKLPAAGYLTAAGIVAKRGGHRDPRVYSLDRARSLRRREELSLAAR